MVESVEKQLKAEIQKLLAEWKKTQDKETLKVLQGMTESLKNLGVSKRSSEIHKETQEHNRAVRSHIERRAELRDKTRMGMPNIANIMAGGAESPISGLGRMQKMASKPFKGVYEYQKSEGRIEELKGKKAKDRSKDEKDELKRLVGERGGSKKRAESGFGKNLMGKRMQGMIGKVGKFMESSKGQGMMAGGMMGASILTMIIKKAMEASPMLQQMLKIMNVAMTLFLRPIGDFIGGMLKPIMLFFLREIAVPMLAKGKGMIKYGETFGKQVLGFLLKPVETITNAIQAAIHWDAGVREISAKFDGVKEWMTEQKMNVIAADLNYGSRDELSSAIDNDTFEAKFHPTHTAAQMNELVEQFKGMREDLKTNEYNYASGYEYEGAGGGVGSGMGAVAGQFTLVSEATGKGVKAMKDLENQLTGGGTGATTTTTTGDGTGTTTTGPVQGPPEAPTPTDTQIAHWSDITVYDTLQKMFAAAGVQIRQGLKAKAGSAEHTQAMKDYTELTGGPGGPGSKSVLEGITRKFEAMAHLIPIQIELEMESRQDLVDSAIHFVNLTSLEKYQRSTMGEEVKDMVQDTVAAHEVVRKLLRNVRNMNAGGSSLGQGWHTNQTGALQSAINASKRANPKAWAKAIGKQHGGMINEPIWGIGESGQGYMFGEAGPERIIPTGASTRDGGGVGPVTINVNVDSINSDVDLEKIKPVIERALQEVHARRGII